MLSIIKDNCIKTIHYRHRCFYLNIIIFIFVASRRCFVISQSKLTVRENRKGNQELTIQRHRHIDQTRHKTTTKKAQKHNATQKTKKMSNKDSIKNPGVKTSACER